MCCSFYKYLPKIESSPSGYPNLTTSLLHAIEAEDWPCKVPSQKENEIQHMKLRHCSYITQSKLQHILKISNLQWHNTKLLLCLSFEHAGSWTSVLSTRNTHLPGTPTLDVFPIFTMFSVEESGRERKVIPSPALNPA